MCDDIDEIIAYMKVSEFKPLYPKIKRDKLIIHYFNDNYNLNQINHALLENKLEPLINKK